MAKVSSRPSSCHSNSGEFGNRAGSGRWGSDKQMSGTRFKICLAGKCNVGKTSLFLRFQGEGFSEEKVIHKVSTFEYFDKEDSTVEYSIWDTGGFEDHNSLTMSDHYRAAHCLILVYDVTDYNSLLYLEDEIKYIDKRAQCPNAKIVLVQNKVDLQQSDFIPLAKLKTFFETSQLRHRVNRFFQTSAKTDENVRDVKDSLKSLLQLPTTEASSTIDDMLTDFSSGKKKDKRRKWKCKHM